MKKLKFLLLDILTIVLFSMNVYAECDNGKAEELREWATKAEVLFTETTGEYASRYAYFLSVTPARDDILVTVADSKGNKANAKLFEDVNLYAVGCFTNLEEETYTVTVYNACSNELLKTMKYTVPRLNRMIKNEACEKYPEHELCQTYTNKTKDMTEKEFLDAIEEYEKGQKTTPFLDKVLSIVREYGIFILVPFLIITLVYIIKIQEFKKKERKK